MAQTSNSDIAAANRLEPTASPSNNEQIQPDTPLTSPSQAPINQTQANNPARNKSPHAGQQQVQPS